MSKEHTYKSILLTLIKANKKKKRKGAPLALRKRVEHELDSLERDGIINQSQYQQLALTVGGDTKPDGNVRLFVDYKVGFNPQLEPAHYPIKKIDDIFNCLRNARVLVLFDGNLPVFLACDASPNSIAVVLLHEIEGEEHPITFISRSLTKSEQNYNQLDRKP
ncbi:hypothetical protein EVAR_67628_1 [Eumeta japonica]|uniref:Reverse transcriptase/retrotransposon-derived protein RNase H-like domain-containing protein n=1 Tax=Eumeta variegata TaxID=151549 RepID=A0A4C2ACW2_EUMVA|nr:hypothetical protein EVAR_67628_1 [Eumeta japonica]